MSAQVEEQADLDLDNYTRVRFQEAREAGLTRLEADRFARGTEPLKTLRALKASGCPPAVIARIVI
jgi:hypothetical protein